MADPTSDTPMGTPEDVRPRPTIKLKPMTPPTPAAEAEPAAAPAGVAETASDVPGAEPAIPVKPSPSMSVPGVKQTIRLRPPSPAPGGDSEAKPAIKIVPKAAEAPTGIPTAKPVEPASTVVMSAPAIKLSKPESSTPTIQLKKPENAAPTIQLKKPESSTPTIQLKKPESSAPTVQLKKPEPASSAEPTRRPGDAPIPPERKLTLKLKSQPSQPKELPKNIIPGLNIPNMPPPVHKDDEQKPADAAAQQAQQTPVAAPVETPTPVPEAVPEDGKKKGKLPKVKKQKAPVTSADEPNWFFLTLSCIVLICVCFIAYLLFAQYMNMYEETEIPVPEFLMPAK